VTIKCVIYGYCHPIITPYYHQMIADNQFIILQR
jgi:hypothetical protein